LTCLQIVELFPEIAERSSRNNPAFCEPFLAATKPPKTVSLLISLPLLRNIPP
jgi:hypothetical protein